MRNRVAAHELKYQISGLIGCVPRSDQASKLRIDFELTVRVAIFFMTNAIRLMVRLPFRGVNNHPCYGEAILLDEQTRGIIDVPPKLIPTAFTYFTGCTKCVEIVCWPRLIAPYGLPCELLAKGDRANGYFQD